MVDALDLKSSGPWVVRVQVPPRVPIARIAQLVEHDLAKVGVAGSSPVSRSLKYKDARVVELVDTLDLKSNEHYVRGGSSPPPGTSCENSSVGRARPCQGRGREFESRFPLSKKQLRNRIVNSYSGFFMP